jgi:ABC-2 type transport system ATP-binding protein
LLQEQVTIFISTAYLDEAERCNRVGLMHQGRLLACGTPAEVKRLMRGAILEISARQPRQMAARLKTEWPAASIGLFGSRVHVVTENPEETAGRLASLLQEAGLAYDGLQVIDPSLEDVFVSVITAEQKG